MNYAKIILTIVLSIISVIGFAQQQEVVIIGTMHGVYGLTKGAYKPMLKKTKKYKPQAIYVEKQPSWDTVSVKNYQPKFYHLSDSLRRVVTLDMDKIKMLKSKATKDLTSEDAKLLRKYYYVNLDLANVGFYGHIAKYGVGPRDRPQGYEDGDLSYSLGTAMGIKEIRSMDNQTFFNEYGTTWRACDSVSIADGEDKYLKRLLRQTWWSDITAVGFLGGLGRINNKPKHYGAYHEINSMEYRKTSCEPCGKANYYWDYRNTQMVKNTAEQIIESGDLRSVIVVGSGHVYGIMEAFARDYPQIKVIGYKDIPDNTN